MLTVAGDQRIDRYGAKRGRAKFTLYLLKHFDFSLGYRGCLSTSSGKLERASDSMPYGDVDGLDGRADDQNAYGTAETDNSDGTADNTTRPMPEDGGMLGQLAVLALWAMGSAMVVQMGLLSLYMHIADDDLHRRVAGLKAN